MKSTGTIRKVDELGRVVLPKSLRRTMGIEEGVTALEIFIEGESVLLRKYQPAGCCDLCGEVRPGIVLFRGKSICGDCRRALSRL